jgi:DNA primase
MDALLPEGLSTRMISLPAGADPDSLLRDQGADVFREALAAARPALEVFMDDQLALHGDSVEGRARAAQEVLGRLRRLPSDLEKDLYAKQLAGLTGLSEELLRDRGRTMAPSRPAVAGVRQSRHSGPASAEGRLQRFLLKLMLADSGVRRGVQEEGTSQLFLDEEYRAVGEHLLQLQQPDGSLPENLVDTTRDDAIQALLASLLMEEDHSFGDAVEQIFADCRRAVARGQLKMRLKQLDALEDAARRDNDDEALHRCLRERMEINLKIKKSP